MPASSRSCRQIAIHEDGEPAARFATIHFGISSHPNTRKPAMTFSRLLSAAALLATGVVIGSLGPSACSEDKKETPMLYELRTYTTTDGGLPKLHQRFKDHTMKLFAKHGMKNVIYFTPADKPNTLVYLLAHKDKEARDASFEAFRNDPAWISARDASEKDGKFVEKVEYVFLNPTDYSPIK
jgi:hypothetical protein